MGSLQHNITIPAILFFVLAGILCCPKAKAQETPAIIRHGLSLQGAPYIANTLEQNGEEQLVTDRTRFDCTTFVETAMAMSLSENKDHTINEKAFAHHLQQIRYRDGIIDGYLSRLHYVADWVNDNIRKGIIEDVTEIYGEDQDTLDIHFMSAHPDSYIHLKNNHERIIQIKAIEKRLTGKTIHWLPKDKLPHSGISWIQNGDVILLTTNIDGLDVSHMGIAVYLHSNLHLLHASSTAKKVIVSPETLRLYLNNNTRITGIRVIRMTQRHKSDF